MRFIFAILLLLHQFFAINGYDASVCAGLHIDLAVFIPSGFQYIFKYSVDVLLAAVDESHTTLTFSNQTTWSLDNKNYFQSAPIQFLNDIEIIQCPSTNGPCTIKIYDGLGLLQIPLSLNGTTKSPILNENLFFDQGTVFDINLSSDDPSPSYFDKESPCILTRGSADFSERRGVVSAFYAPMGLDYRNFVKSCCNHFKDIIVSDTGSNCQKFDGNTIVTDNNNNVVADMSYYIQMKGPTAAAFDVVANKVPDNSQLMATINDNFFLTGIRAASCDYYSLGNKYCTATFNIQQHPKDFQFNIQLRILSGDLSFAPYGPINAAKLIQRNGIWVKNQNQLYTSSDPCWNRTTPIPNGLTAQNSLCCQTFDFSNVGCSSYKSNTNININSFTASLVLSYQFFDKSFVLGISKFDSNQLSTVTIESFSHDTSTQICQATSSYPFISCILQSSKLNTYDIRFKISTLPGEYSITTIMVGAMSQVTSPSVSTHNRCISKLYQCTSLKAAVLISALDSETNGISNHFCCN